MAYAGYVTIDGKQLVAQPDPAQFPEVAGKANCYLCPRGKQYGRGWLLMRRADVTSLNLETSHTIAFIQSDINGTALSQVRLQGAWIIKATRLAQAGGLSGVTSDANSPYLVEFVDRRYLLCKFPSYLYSEGWGKMYNVRHRLPQVATNTGAVAAEYITNSLLSGTTVYTYETMCRDIWRTIGGWTGSAMTYTDFLHSDWPGLPYTPNGSPEGWQFWGCNPWFALHEVLNKLDCDTVYNPLTDTFSVVRLGTQQTDWNRASTTLPYKFDADVIMSNAARIPKNVYSGFHVRAAEPCKINDRVLPAGDNSGTVPVLTSLGSTAAASGIPTTLINGSSVLVWDDLLYQPDLETGGGGAATNSQAVSRAQERFINLQNRCYISEYETKRVFNGIITTVLPGSEIDMVAWRHHHLDGGYETWVSSGFGNSFPWKNDCEEKPLAAIHERTSPPNFARHGWDALWPRTTALVKISDNTFGTSGVDGVCVGTLFTLDPSTDYLSNAVHNDLNVADWGSANPEVVWVVPVNRLGQVLVSNYALTAGGMYIGQLMGTWQAQTSPFDTHALYVVQAADGDILGSNFSALGSTASGPFDVVTSVDFGASTAGTVQITNATVKLPVSWGP